MSQTRQHIQNRRGMQRPRYSRTAASGVRLTMERLEQFINACREEGRVEGTLQCIGEG